MRRLSRLALLSAAAFLGAPLARAAQPCPVPDVDGGRGWPPPLSADAPECAAMLSYLPHFRALESAAGFPNGYWRPVLQRDALDNAYLLERARLMVVTTGFLARHPAADAAVLFTLAHELGHGVQELRTPRPTDPGEQDRVSRRREAHADSIALELLPRAGYDAATAVRGVESLFTCAAVAEDGTPAALPHPSPRTRWINLLRLGPRAPSPRAEYSPALRLEDFDDSGRLIATPAPDAESEKAAVRACGRLTRATFDEAVAIGRSAAPPL
jgi:predicted Zn-dependent protease